MWPIIILLGVLSFAPCESGTCGSIGSSYSQDFQDSDPDGGLILGTGDAATCDGTLSGFQYCFRVEFPWLSYEANLAIYRPSGINYTMVASTLVTLASDNWSYMNEEIACLNKSVEPSITITKGDVIGICLGNWLSSPLGVFVSLGTSLDRKICDGRDVPQFIQYEERSDKISVLGILSVEAKKSSVVSSTDATDNSNTTKEDLPEAGRGSVFGNLPIPDIAIYVIIGVVSLLLIMLCCFCTVCVCKYVKKRRRLHQLSAQINDMVHVDCDDDIGDSYVNYGAKHPILIENGRRLVHVIGPEHLSKSGDYTTVNPMLNLARDSGDSGIVQSNSETSSTNGFHGVDGTRVHYADILSLNQCKSSDSTKTEDGLHEYLDSHQVNTLKRTDIMVESTEVDGYDKVGVWMRDDDRVRIHLKKSGDENRVEWLQEAAILSQLKHTNIIKFYGILKDDLCVTIVQEDLPRTLKSYLGELRQKSSNGVPRGTSRLLLTFCQQVALGMKYISDKGFVHGNLMASNVMVSSDNECKITNFDMTHAITHGRGHELRDMVTMKWNSPEVIEDNSFSTASDVWSFASLLYEIWSLGRDPFEGESNINVIERIVQGRRLYPPSGCPRALYELMIQCWNVKVFERPSFPDLVMDLTRPDILLLHIPLELVNSHPECGQVGEPLSVGKLMYQDLQVVYCTRYRQ